MSMWDEPAPDMEEGLMGSAEHGADEPGEEGSREGDAGGGGKGAKPAISSAFNFAPEAHQGSGR